MSNRANVLTYLIITLIFCGCSKTFTPFAPSVNRTPVISSLKANLPSVNPNSSAIVSVVATDADGETLTYSWSCSAGTLTGTGASVSWKAPLIDGSYNVAVTVNDGRSYGTATKTTAVSVITDFVPGNNLPVIGSVSADRYSLPVGQNAVITCFASDPDGDTLTYTWTDDHLQPVYPNSNLIQVTSCHPGAVNVQLFVSDGRGGSVIYNVPTITFN